MQIKPTMRFYFILPTRAKIKKTGNNRVGEDVEKLEPSYTVGRNAKQSSHFGEQLGSFSES